jgi:GGDEF domain-containing protein
MGDLGVTVSLGAAELSPDMFLLDDLLEEANQAEHMAKEAGRNCVRVNQSVFQ